MKEFWNQITDWLAIPVVRKLVVLAVVILILLAIARFMKNGLSRYVEDKDNRYRSRKIVNFGLYIALVLAILFLFSDNLGGIGVTLGVAGAGIAFALQEVIASVAGWIAVVTGGFYKPGDRVQLGGIKGDVIDIGVLRTTMMETGNWVDGDQYNGRIVRVANSFVFKEPVFNYSSDFPFLWDEIKVPIRYGADIAETRKMLEDIAERLVGEYAKGASESWSKMVRKYLIEDARVHPRVNLIGTDNWMEFTVRYAVDYKRRRSTKDDLWTAIITAVQATNGRIQLASATYEITAFPPLTVAMNKGEG